ncbi:MAG: DUF4115 domain-containing protein [Deltaproteobacteria bacterium]|jgi:cytoskeletal protein RodZ|nr:DUF4115 domain-containing protein [Deltaproteobacteria bacterium]
MQIDKLMELGAFLKEKRMEQGLEREEIASKIKVSAKTLYALEEALTDSLPQPIFAMGFARSYAKALNLETDETHVLIQEAFSVGSLNNINPELSALSREKSITINQTSNTRAALVLLPIILFLIVGLLWGIYQIFGSDIRDIIASPPATEQSAGRTVPAGVTPRRPPQAAPDGSAREGMALSESSPRTSEAETENANQQESTADYPPSLSRQSNTKPDSPLPAGLKRVVIYAKAECWIGAEFDESGLRSFVLEPGQTFALDFRSKLKLTLGNSGVIEMSYNGRPYNINGRFRESKVISLPPQ